MKELLIKITTVLIGILLLTGCGFNNEFADTSFGVPIMSVTSPSIVDGKLLPTTAADKKTNNPVGENKSPAVRWEEVEGANYYAVIMFDESANWLHLLVTDITTTKVEEGEFSDKNVYVGPYPGESSGEHTYRIEVFAIKEQPKYPIGELDTRESYRGIIKHLNQVSGRFDNILARGYVKGTYKNNAQTLADIED